jgi:hypothetical protein
MWNSFLDTDSRMVTMITELARNTQRQEQASRAFGSRM